MATHICRDGKVRGFRQPKPIAERFWPKVDKRGPDDCWEWQANRVGGKSLPYGRINEGGKLGKQIFAHRVSWELHFGQVPNGLCVLHKCDNPPCVNPSHLFLGTYLDNARDRDAKGRARKGPPMRGELCGMAKLTKADVLRIRELAAVSTQRSIALQFGVSVYAISDVLKRKTWFHV